MDGREQHIQRLIEQIKPVIEGENVDVAIAAMTLLVSTLVAHSGYKMADIIEYLRDTNVDFKLSMMQ